MIHAGWLVAVVAMLAGPAQALESAPVHSARATVTLISDTDAILPGQPFHVGLRLRLAPGWHTYWKNPGDAGVAAELTLNLPPDAKAGPIEWPAPQRMPEGPLLTYGYTGEVVLPVTVTPVTVTPGAGPLPVQATATWLVCEKVCVPEEGSFRLDLPQGHAGPSAQAPAFAASEARTPRPSPFEAHMSRDGVLSLAGAGLSAASVKEAWFFPTAPGSAHQDSDHPATVQDGVVQMRLQPSPDFDPAAHLSGVVTLRDGGGQDSFLQIDAAPGPAPAAPAEVDLLRMVLFAFLGGLILNLMPCVFPILAMKAVAIARMSGSARGALRAQAASYTLGVLAAFTALGALLLGLRAAGSVAGWGFQFQSPVFVSAMAWLLFAVGLNLSGVFQVGAGLTGSGQALASRGGHLGSFFTGLLAVLVATPCTAPFMGVAIAAALAAPPATALLVFAALGLGLAAPFALLAVVPGLSRLLPRPGAWMDVMKGALAFPMYAAAAWLVWVVSLQSGSDAVLATVAGMVLVGFALWAWGLAQAGSGRGRRLGYIASVLGVAGAAAVLSGLAAAAAGPLPAAAASEGVEKFTAARLASLRAEGRPVFVNMTAAWCVTCLVNERVALSPAAVRDAFAARHVAYLKGDWTRQNPEITAYLRSMERDGVPLYVLYPPHAGEARMLPQILTEGTVLAELEKL